MRTLSVQSVAVILVAVAPMGVEAASFDCSRAATTIETTICKDSTLSAADEEMAALYLKAKAIDPSMSADQANWLSAVRDRCGNAECLADAYLDRIAVLEKKVGDVRELPHVIEPPPAPAVTPAISAPAQPTLSAPAEENHSSGEDTLSSATKGTPDWVIALMLGAGFLYLLPSIVAFNRNHEHRWAILIANIFLAPTVIGWFIALAFASGLIGGTAAITLAAMSDSHGRNKHRQ